MNKYPYYLIPANTPPDLCKYCGKLNASQGWSRQLNPRWTDEQTRAYNEGYNEGKESSK
jgi:hypothetical protein